jgi:hypothetical protein
LDLGRRSRTVGRKLRRHVLHRDGGVHRGRLYQPIPARSPPCPPLVPRRNHRCRQSDQSLLVSPSCVHPSRRPGHPSDRDQPDPTETTPIGAPFPRPDNPAS